MSEAIERWLPVAGYEGLYEVSNLGRVKSYPRKTASGVRGGCALKPLNHSFGYSIVVLYKDAKRQMCYVHALVAEAFIGGRPAGMQACHNDGNPKNNCLSNLRWDTVAGNHADKLKHNTHHRGERSPSAKLTDANVISIRSDPRSLQEIATEYGVHKSHICQIKKRRFWAHIP